MNTQKHSKIVKLFVLTIISLAFVGNAFGFHCYQESTNQSSSVDDLCYLNYSGVSFANWTQNNIDTATSGIFYYINYSKPVGALSDSVWVVKYGNAVTTKFSIP